MGYAQLVEFCDISGCPVVGQVKLRCDRASKSTGFGHLDVVDNRRWLLDQVPGCVWRRSRYLHN